MHTNLAFLFHPHTSLAMGPKEKLDSAFREQDVGTAASEEQKETWRSLAQQWVKKELQNKIVLPQDEAVKQTKIQRLATKHHLAAIDYILTDTTSEGLAQFVPAARLAELQQALKPPKKKMFWFPFHSSC